MFRRRKRRRLKKIRLCIHSCIVTIIIFFGGLDFYEGILLPKTFKASAGHGQNFVVHAL